MQLLTDKDNIWDLISKEQTFKSNHSPSILIKDLISLDIAQLKQDAYFLDKIISFSPDDRMSVNLHNASDYLHFLKMLRNNDFLENSSQSDSDT